MNANEYSYCPQCRALLPAAAQFCEQCGARVTPQPMVTLGVFPAAPTPDSPPSLTPPPAPPAPKKRTLAWLLPLLAAGCLGLVCIGGLALGGITYLRDRQSAQPVEGPVSWLWPTVTPTAKPALPATEPPADPTQEPTAGPTLQPVTAPTKLAPTEPTAQTEPAAPPTEPAAPPAGTGLSVQESFTRWPLDYSLQWELGQTDAYITDINQDGSWIIALTQPESLVMVIPPHPSAYYPQGALITVQVKPGDAAASGPYGVLCNFQDENNYYLVEIQGDQFAAGKLVAGRFTPLTDPYWQPSQFIGDRGANGFIELGVACVDHSIGISLNGLAETFPIDDPGRSFSGGAVALFGASGQEAVDMLMGIFYFKDLIIEPIG